MNHSSEQPVFPLTTLPTELIRRVAAQCPGRTLMALAATSHPLRSICHDVIVFREAILNNLQEESCKTRAHEQITAISTRAKQDLNIWARYAVAIDMADNLPSLETLRDPELRDKILRSVMFYVIQLLAIGYTRPFRGNLAQRLTAAARTDPDGKLHSYSDRYVFNGDILKLAVWSAAEAIGEPHPSSTSTQLDTQDLAEYHRFLNSGAPRDSYPLCGENYYTLIGIFARALKARGNLVVPDLRRVPLLQQDLAAQLPLPFAVGPYLALSHPVHGAMGGDGGGFWVGLRMRRDIMALRFETTRWCGYRSDDLSLSGFGPFMEEIKLEMWDEDNGGMKGIGREGNVFFTLDGRWWNSLLTLEQRGLGLPRCRWEGRPTLFGILGHWMLEGAEYPSGWFWIWNESWM